MGMTDTAARLIAATGYEYVIEEQESGLFWLMRERLGSRARFATELVGVFDNPSDARAEVTRLQADPDPVPFVLPEPVLFTDWFTRWQIA
jgi:hypothetical protein